MNGPEMPMGWFGDTFWVFMANGTSTRLSGFNRCKPCYVAVRASSSVPSKLVSAARSDGRGGADKDEDASVAGDRSRALVFLLRGVGTAKKWTACFTSSAAAQPAVDTMEESSRGG